MAGVTGNWLSRIQQGRILVSHGSPRQKYCISKLTIANMEIIAGMAAFVKYVHSDAERSYHRSPGYCPVGQANFSPGTLSLRVRSS